jgi:hypothetical protein
LDAAGNLQDFIPVWPGGTAALFSAVAAGGELLGFLGVLLAAPTAAVLRVGLGEALRACRESSVYGGEQL